jgi:adenine-specific DNA-methyltransferase
MNKEIQTALEMVDVTPRENIAEFQFEPIKGYSLLTWRGKRPFTSTRYYPAQLKETHGPEKEGFRSKIYWGDNLQVMSHLLKQYRGQIKLIYIDPPFDSKADYKKRIDLHGKSAQNDLNAFEEMQYTDIWSNDEYLQFMYERLLLMRELLSDNGSLWLQCDYRKDSHLRLLLDEIFGPECYRGQVIWNSTRSKGTSVRSFGVEHQILMYYTKNEDFIWNQMFRDYDVDKIDRYYCFFEQDDGSFLRYTKSEVKDFRLKNEYPKGRRFALVPLLRMLGGERKGLTYEFMGFNRTWSCKKEKMLDLQKAGRIVQLSRDSIPQKKQYFDEMDGIKLTSLWDDISPLNPASKEKSNYPTQKPEALLERIIKISTNPGDLVFDCFMGSGTTQAVAMKSGRRFIGADINLAAVQISTKRLLEISKALKGSEQQSEFFSEENGDVPVIFYTGFEVYNVNHYDVFRNPVEARELLLEAYEVNKLPQGQLFDGEKDGRMVKIMPVNRIATRADLSELIAGLDLKAFEKRYKKNPNEPVEKITLVCMGSEPDLKASLMKEVEPYKLDVEVVDILRHREDLQFKRVSEAKIVITNGELVIKSFYPMNLLGKLSLQKEKVKNWCELVESVMIDWNYDRAVFTPTTVDIPEKDEMVSGTYLIPKHAGTIRVKITDLLSESLEVEVAHG